MYFSRGNNKAKTTMYVNGRSFAFLTFFNPDFRVESKSSRVMWDFYNEVKTDICVQIA